MTYYRVAIFENKYIVAWRAKTLNSYEFQFRGLQDINLYQDESSERALRILEDTLTDPVPGRYGSGLSVSYRILGKVSANKGQGSPYLCYVALYIIIINCNE
jgi:hypothetical protein